jgi:hypothetical protein
MKGRKKGGGLSPFKFFDHCFIFLATTLEPDIEICKKKINYFSSSLLAIIKTLREKKKHFVFLISDFEFLFLAILCQYKNLKKHCMRMFV